MGRLLAWITKHPMPAAAVGLAALLLLANLPLALGLRVGRWDADTFFAPAQILVADHARAGQLLLWNPWSNGGSPDGIDPQFGSFFPVNVLYGLIAGGSEPAFRWYWLGVWLGGGIGMLLLTHHLGVPGWGCFVGSSGFMLSGLFTGNAEHTSWLVAYAALPWVIWRWDVALRRSSLLAAAQAGAVWGLSALAGYPGVVLADAALVAFWTAGRLLAGAQQRRAGRHGGPRPGAMVRVDYTVRGEGQTARPASLRFASLGVATLFMVGLIVLSPTYLAFLVEGRGYTDRAGPLPREAVIGNNVLHPAALVSLASPHVPMHKLANPQQPIWTCNDVSSMSVYFGAAVTWLAVLGLVLRPRDAWRWCLLATAAVALGAAMGEWLPLRGWLYDYFPPSRYFQNAALFRGSFLFAACVLAAEGCRDLSRMVLGPVRSSGRVHWPAGRPWRAVAAAGVLSAAIAVVAYFVLVGSLTAHHKDRGLADLHVILCWTAVAAVALAAPRLVRSRRFGTSALPRAIVVLTVVDLIVACQLARHTISAKTGKQNPWRTVTEQRDGDLDLTHRGLSRRLVDPIGGKMDNKNIATKVPVFLSGISLCNEVHQDWAGDAVLTRCVVSERRIWFAPSADVIEVAASRAAYRAFKARAHQLRAVPLVVHRPEAFRRPSGDDGRPEPLEKIGRLPAARQVDVVLEEYLPNRLSLRCEVPEDGYLLVTDRWARGWRASVNGRPAPVLVGDFLFRAVPVRAGTNRVQLTYSPFGFPYLLVMSWSVAGVVLIVPAVAAARNRLVSSRGGRAGRPLNPPHVKVKTRRKTIPDSGESYSSRSA